ncbi:MAG: HigA family addiction module antitoxin [Patescibacteria group bacterium]|jgi:HTH-type transcriptional regulator/antitoxin HigA|nr:HigA family addiction module antitoxin [Patescibacteria group bacterium]
MVNTKQNTPVLILPGETLVELLEEKGMTQLELAERMGRPPKTINEIIKGKASITPETAIQLEGVFSVPASFWMNLESNYQIALARFNFVKKLENEYKIAEKYPYKEMVKLGWINPCREVKEVVKCMLNFFGVISLENVVEKNIFVGAQYRISSKKNHSKEAVTAWLRKGVLEAQKIDTSDFNEKKLRENIPDIKKLMFSSPSEFMPKLTRILADCGVALVILKNLKNVPDNGVTRWISPKKSLIQMSIRGKYADICWFSLFHEIGHLLLHRKKGVYVDFENENINKDQEREANNFASEILIPEMEYKNFVTKFKTLRDINILKSFAKNNGVINGIVVGRLQNDEIIGRHQLNSLRNKYEWLN